MELTRETLQQLFDQLAPELDMADPKDARKKRILDAAQELFVEQGFRKTSIDEVAGRAHVAKGTVYAHFDNKGSLLMAVMAYEKRRYLAQILDVFSPELSGTERLRRYLGLFVTMPSESPLLSRLLSGDGEIRAMIAELNPGMVKEMQGMQMQFLTKLLDDGLGQHTLSREQLTEKASVLYSLVIKVAQASQDPFGLGFSPQRYAELVMDMLQQGMTKAWGKASEKRKTP
jgi:AcrR family transcriptional regulator